jgi:hypothetical protein
MRLPQKQVMAFPVDTFNPTTRRKPEVNEIHHLFGNYEYRSIDHLLPKSGLGGSATIPWATGRPRLSVVPALGHDPLQCIIRALFHQQVRKGFLKPQAGAVKWPSKQDGIMTYVKYKIIVFLSKIARTDFTKMRTRTSLLANRSF